MILGLFGIFRGSENALTVSYISIIKFADVTTVLVPQYSFVSLGKKTFSTCRDGLLLTVLRVNVYKTKELIFRHPSACL